MSLKKVVSILTTSLTHLVSMPSPSSLSVSINKSPSIRSIGGTPSLMASRVHASLVNVPVVMNSPFVSAARHRTAKVTYLGWRNETGVTLALEHHREAH